MVRINRVQPACMAKPMLELGLRTLCALILRLRPALILDEIEGFLKYSNYKIFKLKIPRKMKLTIKESYDKQESYYFFRGPK